VIVLRYNKAMKTLNFPNYISATDELMRIMASVEENPDVEHVIIVPEVYTLEYEKLIYGRGKGSFSIQVKSFNRLFSAYCDDSEVVSKSGAILLIKKIAYDISPSLTCFKNSYTKSGFALKMYETISRLKDQRIDPETMKADSLKKNKIHDVKLIYQEYIKRTQDKYVDTIGKKNKLAEYFNALSEKQNKYYYVLNFDVLTESTLNVLNAIDAKSNGVTIFNVKLAPQTSNAKSLTVYKAKNMVDQIKAVSRSISRDLYNGVSPDDIVVAGEGLEYDTIKRVLSDFNIPFYMSKKESLGVHPLAIYLILAIQCVRKGMNRDDVIALVKNPAIFASKRERDAFCRYVYENLVDYKGFLSSFDRDSAYKEKAEKVRQRIAKLFLQVGVIRSNMSVSDFTNVCKTVLENAYMAPLLEDEENKVAVETLEFEKAKELIVKALDFIGRVYGNGVMSSEFLVDSLRDLLASTEFSMVQKTSKVIKIGTLNDFRGQRYKKIYLLSFNDGLLPKIEEDVALLTDSDIVEMKSLKLLDRISVLNARYKDELWQLLQNECDLFASYVCEENGKKSYDLQILQGQYSGKVKSRLSYVSSLNTCLDAETFASLVADLSNAKELLCDVENVKLFASLKKAIGETKKDEYSFEQGMSNVDTTLTKTSVSGLQTYYKCPFMYFCSYVLGVEKSEDGRVTPLDVGKIIHATLSEVFDPEFKDKIADEKQIKNRVLEIMGKVLEQTPKASLEANQPIVERLKNETVKATIIAYNQLKKGNYEVEKCEASYGREYNDEKKYKLEKTLVFKGKKGDVKLVGDIDRIDVCKDTLRARVIDYKTGSDKFSYADLYYATQLQLPLYMSVVMENGKKPGGFFYFPATASWSEKESSNMLNGIFELSDENILAMERGSISAGATVFDMPLYARNKTPNKKNGLSEDEIRKVCDYAIRMAQNAINKIEHNEFKPLPIKINERKKQCDYCDYKGICKLDGMLAREEVVTDAVAKKYFITGGSVDEQQN